MKNMIAVLIVIAFSSFCYAQNSPSQSTEEVSVISASYAMRENGQQRMVEYRIPVEAINNSTLAAQPPRDNLAIKRQTVPIVDSGNLQNRALVQFKNNTQKKVTSIEYNFIVVKNDGGEELKRYAFVNNSDVKANKTKTLSNVITGSELNRYFNGLALVLFKAEITRVTYQDGSVWIP